LSLKRRDMPDLESAAAYSQAAAGTYDGYGDDDDSNNDDNFVPETPNVNGSANKVFTDSDLEGSGETGESDFVEEQESEGRRRIFLNTEPGGHSDVDGMRSNEEYWDGGRFCRDRT
jgi:hypothetical protein